MRHAIIAIAILAIVSGVVIGLRVHAASERAEQTKLAVEHTREEARQLIHICDNRAGLAGQIETATSRFRTYIATGDRENMRRVMNDLVFPSLDAYETACTGAQTDIEFVQHNADEPDSWIDAKANEVADHIANVAIIRAAAKDLAVEIDSNASNDVLAERFAALTVMVQPPPSEPIQDP